MTSFHKTPSATIPHPKYYNIDHLEAATIQDLSLSLTCFHSLLS